MKNKLNLNTNLILNPLNQKRIKTLSKKEVISISLKITNF